MRPETHLIVPVPAAEALVGEYRERLDPVAAQGVPAHITILGHFIEHAALVERDVRELTALFASVSPIRFALRGVAEFPHALYLEPDPEQPFIDLTRAVWARWPRYPPYAGAHRDIVPHLTVAVGERCFDEVRNELAWQLPLQAQAREVWLLAHGSRGWYSAHRFALGGAADAGSSAC